jgi:hypothetical protein
MYINNQRRTKIMTYDEWKLSTPPDSEGFEENKLCDEYRTNQYKLTIKTKKMEIEVKKVVIEKVEVSLPCYRKDAAHLYKVITEDECICVGKNYAIKILSASLAWTCGDDDATEEEFTQAFNDTLNFIQNKIHGN